MWNLVLISTSKVMTGSGGGNVSLHEYNALLKVSKHVTILDSSKINPVNIGLPDSPFLWDWLAAREIANIKAPDLLFINGNPFGLTSSTAKALNDKCKIIVDVPAHNLEESVKEFTEMLKVTYPFKHMIDEKLWNLYTEHIIAADAIIFPSVLSKDYLVWKLKLDERRCYVIPHGCNPPAEVKPFPDKFTVGHVGVNGPDKGQTYLYNAWKLLNFTDGILMIAGQGTELWQPYGLGYISEQELDGFYNGLSVYVQPSVTEGFGIPVLEAMSYGRPVIVTEGAGAKELVTDGEEGFIVPIRDPQAIAEKLNFLYHHQNIAHRMGMKAREKALNYTWDIVEKLYENVIKSTLGV
jgi:glycosyltransferase involved in cell wall biosynthesis